MIESIDSPRYLWDFISVFIIGFFLSIGIARLTEEHSVYGYMRIWLNWLLPISIVSLIYLYIRTYQVESIEYITHLLIFWGIFLSFVYIGDILGLKKKPTENSIYARYFTEVSWDFLMSMIVGLALFALSWILLFSLDELFDITFDNSFAHIANISFVLASGFYFLMHFPDSYTLTEKKEARFFHFLIRYVFTPFIIIYFVVLYVYSIKVIAMSDEWPRGIICWLVIGFSTLGYLQYILGEPLHHEKLVGITRKYFPYLVIPQTAMLFYAISLRIGQYGITVNRYLVVIFGIWLIIISLYLILSRKKSLQIIISILSITLIIISIGPWWVLSMSYRDQWTRLENNLKKANILQNGIIVPLKTKDDIDQNLSVDIFSGIEYLCGFKNCEDIRKLFEKELKDIPHNDIQSFTYEYEWTDKWEVSNHLEEKLKLYRYKTQWDDVKQSSTISLYNGINAATNIIDIQGYNLLIESIWSNKPSGRSLELIYFWDMKWIGLYQSGKLLETINIAPYTTELQNWYKQEKTTNKWNNLYATETDRVRIKFIFDSYTLDNPLYTGNDIQSSWISGKALITLK